MKVYELMDALSEANAGAEVKVSFSISAEEFSKADEIDRDVRVFTKDISDVVYLPEWRIDIEL